MSPAGKVSIEWSDLPVHQVRQREIGMLGKDIGRHRNVQKRVLGGEGLTRVGWDDFGSSLDAELRFCELALILTILALHMDKIDQWEFERGADFGALQAPRAGSSTTMSLCQRRLTKSDRKTTSLNLKQTLPTGWNLNPFFVILKFVCIWTPPYSREFAFCEIPYLV